jgi:hypothetical protein
MWINKSDTAISFLKSFCRIFLQMKSYKWTEYPNQIYNRKGKKSNCIVTKHNRNVTFQVYFSFPHLFT